MNKPCDQFTIQMEEEFNRKNVKNAIKTMLVSSIPLVLTAIIFERLKITWIPHAVCVLVISIAYAMQHHIKHPKIAMYLGGTLFFVSAILSGVVLRPTGNSLLFTSLLTLFAFWTTDKPKRVIIYLSVMVMIFSVAVYFAPGRETKEMDVVAALCGLICASFLSHVTYKFRAELYKEKQEVKAMNEELQRQEEVLNKQMEEIKEMSYQNYRLAHYDPLTGLPNYRRISELIAHHLGSKVTLAMCDVDWFKQVNDTLGHPEGDKVLISLGKAFETLEMLGIRAYRIGGEEFYFFSDEMSPSVLADIIQTTVRKRNISHPTSKFGKITVSTGATRRLIESSEDFEEMMKEVDELAYQAKNNGRNCVVVKDEN